MKFTLDNDTVLSINEYLKQFNVKYVFCGDFSLYLNGIKEVNEFNDVDIDFYESTQDEKDHINVGFILDTYPIDKLKPIDGIPLKFHTIKLNDEDISISDLDYELEIREYLQEHNLSLHPEEQVEKIRLIKEYLNVGV